ncbi:helix-turn-helix domain-containing protein [Paenibacillus sp. J5C_2022]|uniref:AraC family transcriptional regulator n=1 Tax=Paenibacillus sp. J5C2022 TaxID=2977129 RepID=UPI0021D179E7|nr:helix-turn-helix domain-containing protein [Paenibacillus sp. J5C2022]MCU6712284.1 helix-turn-helix domain-containing protein [Paenibacillus sp. J5C2022]
MAHTQHRWTTYLKQLRHKNRSVFLTWMLSYISVLLVPILISGIIYGAALHVVKTEMNRANKSILLQMEQAIDSQFKGIESLSLEVGLNKRISDFLLADAELTDADHYQIYQIANDLRVYEIANDFIESIYIYYKNSDTVIARNERMNGEGLYDVIRFDENMMYETFSEYFDQRYVSEYRPVVIAEGREWSPSVMYAQSVALTILEQPGAIILIMIDHNKLLEHAPVPEDSTVLILDENNRVIATTGSTQDTPVVRYEEMPAESGQVESDVLHRPMVASYTTSAITGWKYVMTTPAKVYHQKMNVVKQLTFASILLSLIVGGFVTYLLLKRNYTPIHTLIESLSFKASVSFDRGSNEFSFLEQALNSTFLEKEELLHKLNQHNNTLRSHFLQRLLKGQLESQIPLHESFSAHDVRFTQNGFSVMLLRIEHFGKFDQEEEDRVRNRSLLQFLIANVVEEVARESANAYAIELDQELLACIVNHQLADPADQRAELERIAEATKRFISQHTHVQLTVAVSAQQEAEYGISQAFQEALEAMEYRIVAGSGGIIHYNDLVGEDGQGAVPGYFYPLKAEQQLIAFVREGQKDKAETFIGELIHKNVMTEPFSFHNAKCLMFDLMATLQKVIAEIHTTNKPEVPDGVRAIERLTQCQTVGEMREQLYELLERICDYVNANRDYNSNPLIDKVMKYVHDHYRDENLNISMIGEAFSMTPSYVSKLFKEHTGESLLDFINKTRLVEAKLLLTEEKYTISEVALMVGYNDVNTFHRIFKKFEGITPGRYREIK